MSDLTFDPSVEMTPAARLESIRDLLRRAENLRLQACALLAVAYRGEDWKQLGLDTFTEYVEQLGIPQSTGSKMLTAGRVFTGEYGAAWDALPPADRAELSVERLYIAGQLVERGIVPDRTEALHEAVANPPHYLIAKRDGTDPEVHRCECPHCGNTHFAPNEKATADDVPF